MMNHSRAQSGRSAVDERPDDRSTLDRDPAHGTATDEPPKGFLGLSIPQLLGGAFAAVSTAVVASFLGVAGTLIGAALGSIVSTVSAAVYTSMANNAQSRVRQVAIRPTRGARGATAAPRSAEPRRDSTPSGRRFDLAAARRAVRPRTLLAATAVVFALAIGLITALEIGLGRPVSASETTGTRSGTSLSQVVQDVSGQSAPAPTEAPTPAEVPTDGATPGNDATPGQDPTVAPSDGATANPEGSPTAPADGSGDSTRPTDAPTQGGTGADPGTSGNPGTSGGPGSAGDQPANPTPQAPAPTEGSGANPGSGQAG